MSQLTRPAGPAHYELRVKGHLDQHWSAWFGGLTLTHQDDGTTTLRGLVTDQAQLHGMLAKVRDLGVTLISVSFLASVPDQQSQEAPTPPRPGPAERG